MKNMKKYGVIILSAPLILLLGFFLLQDKQPNKIKELKNPTIKESTQAPNQIVQASTTTQITYFDICKEKAKKYAQFYLINDKECRLLYSNDFKTLEDHDKVFENYDALYKAEVGNKIDRVLSSESVDFKSFYKKDNRYYVDFKTDQRMGMYNVCENKDKKTIKKDIFGNQATFICDGEQNILVTDFPVVTLEVSSDAIINFIGNYASGRRDLFSLTPDEYVTIWPMYSINGQDDMRVYVKNNIIMDIEQIYVQ